MYKLTIDTSCRPATSQSYLTADTLSRLEEQGRSQLDTWLEEPQSHEQLAVGKRTGRTANQIAESFEDIETNVRGNDK